MSEEAQGAAAACPSIEEKQALFVDLWHKSEQVAMHFNDLILNFRLKAVGAITVAGGLIGTVLLTKADGPPPRFNFIAFAIAMAFLCMVWGGIWIIDACYYQRLLRGAVRDAIRLEKMSGNLIQLSTLIEKDVEGDRVTNGKMVSGRATWAFYGLPFLAFLLAMAMAIVAMPARDEMRARAVERATERTTEKFLAPASFSAATLGPFCDPAERVVEKTTEMVTEKPTDP
jgi:hypothetical protein